MRVFDIHDVIETLLHGCQICRIISAFYQSQVISCFSNRWPDFHKARVEVS